MIRYLILVSNLTFLIFSIFHDMFRYGLIPFDMSWYTFYRLQLKRGLFWYRHHPKMHEMVSDRSSRAENLTDFPKFQCASFLIRKNVEKWQYGPKKHKNVVFRGKKSLRSYTGHTKVGKNKFPDIIYLNWINLIVYN